ncbi:7816_t:CDS:10 [Ambispora gerdemannii]|uniref:7816_t:CDS:1 n=1 Tax=Ambispora gerdemannii TaxID=144530 RepID=A0A9N8Z1R4_9GLOM|nr:7816_t:CDS:10 [Ambispora gerdemannii]
MYRIPRAVPWTSIDEYEQVHQWLYAETAELQDLGVKRVKAWSSRGQVPHAIISTASFVEVSMRDSYCNDNHSMNRISEHELRFVNGMVDPAQKGVYAVSIATLATKLNLPLWFVELRHAGTHEILPSLQILRNGVQQALNWLKENYWTSQKPLFTLQINDIRGSIQKYKNLQKQYLKDAKPNQKSRDSMKSDQQSRLVSSETALNIVKQIQRAIRSTSGVGDSVIPILLETGFLVPIGKKKRVTPPDYSLTDELIQLWAPLLQTLDEFFDNFGNELIQGILEKLDFDVFEQVNITTSHSYLMTLVSWIQHILNIYYEDEFNSTCFKDIHIDSILEFCLRKPNPFTRIILQYLIDNDDGNNSELKSSVAPFLNYIDRLLETGRQTNLKTQFNNTPTQQQLTDQEMNDMIKNLKRQLKESASFEETISDDQTTTTSKMPSIFSAWTLYDHKKWQSCPIGCLPNGKVACLDLPLELDN